MKEQQTPRDKVLWILGSSDGEMSISRLRSITDWGMRVLISLLKNRKRRIGLLYGQIS